MFLVNSRLGLVSATLNAFEENSNTHQVPLIPKLRGYFAEFLHHDSLDRLSILYLSTCVGLGYWRLISRSRSFSRQHRITLITLIKRTPHVSGTRAADLPTTRPTHLTRQTNTVESYLPASLRSLPTKRSGHRLNQDQSEDITKPRMLSITSFSTDDISPVREYQPVVHRLRLSASP